MNNSTVTEKAFNELRKYVNRTTRSSFDTNMIRERLASVKGLKKTQLSGVINRALNQGLIRSVGTTASSQPNHNKGRVTVYSRSASN
jgi:hypothetical protein